jgi:hypothetical protein
VLIDPAVAAVGFGAALRAVFRFALFLAALLAGFFDDFLFALRPTALLFFFFFAAFLLFLFLAIVASVDSCETQRPQPVYRARAIQVPGTGPGELNSFVIMLTSKS